MSLLTPSDSSQGGKNMRIVHFNNEFPNISLVDALRSLHLRSKSKNHIILGHFLEGAIDVLNHEIAALDRKLKDLIPPFELLSQLAENETLSRGPLGESFNGAFLCVVEIGNLISFYEEHPQDYNLEIGTSVITGLGVGLIASAAVALSPCLADIPLAGVESIRLAFKLGVLVDAVSQNIESRNSAGHSESWAHVLTDVTEEAVQRELAKIYEDQPCPRSCQIYISGIAESSVTITGPPSRLKDLLQTSELFRGLSHVALPVYGGLCHASHIYGQQHIDSVINTNNLESLGLRCSTIVPILSTSTGKQYRATGALELYEQLATELLTQPITWSNVVREAVQIAENLDAWECEIISSKESHSVRELLSTLSTRLPDFKTKFQETTPSSRPLEVHQATRGLLQSKIAIVGMACRYPGGANNTEKFWSVLEQGLDVHRKVPIDRFDADLHTDPSGKRVNTSVTPYGCFVDDPGLFDAQFFNMSPREAEQTDPMQRLALVTAYEAMERAGYVANRTRSTNLKRSSVFYGQSSDDYREANVSPEIGTYFIPGGNRAFGPGRINYFFKFAGPSFNCDTACSSSLATIQIACTSLWAGDTDMVIAGGMNLLSNSDSYAGLSAGHFLSKTGSSKTWDAEADGYCRGDGIGTVVLKRLEDAEADNDIILGVILAAATNHSAEAISITHPHAGAQSDLYRQVMHRAGVSPLDVSFVELHGTGTQAGDSVEIESITNVFAPSQGQKRRPTQPLHIGAVKSNIGHGEAAAGVTALMKVLCMMEKNAIPPHVGIKNNINPLFPKDFGKRNLHIPYRQVPWPRNSEQKRVAIINNFSAAGGNTTLALEDAPSQKVTLLDPRAKHVVAVSAKHKASLQANVQRLIAFMEANEGTKISDLSYTTCARRQHYDFRVAIAASTIEEASDLLTPYLDVRAKDSFKPLTNHAPPPTVAFVFTGQGTTTQVKTKLYNESPSFKSQIDQLDHIAQVQGFPSVIPAIDNCSSDSERLSPVVTQLALVCLEISLARYWMSLGVTPTAVIGHSLGEYAALHIAGVLSANDAIFLAGTRARLLQRSCSTGSHTMLAIRGTLADIAASAAKNGNADYHVACINGDNDIVISGTRQLVEAMSSSLKTDGFKCHILDVPFAFHSPQVDTILEPYESIARRGAIFKAPELPVISPLLAKVVFDDRTFDATYMARATREPVNFVAALRAAEDMGIVDADTVWIENGPHHVCSTFVRNILGSVKLAVPSICKSEDAWTTLATSMSKLHCAGIKIDWNEFNRPFEKNLKLLDLPTYAWNNRNYWVPYKGAWNLTKVVNSGSMLVTKETSSLKTSSVQRVVEEEFTETAARIVMRSDVMHPDFLDAANGHKMNGCGVVTSSIHADLIFTLANYMLKRLNRSDGHCDVNILDMQVTKGLVAKKDRANPQLFEVRATMDFARDQIGLEWCNITEDNEIEDPFATAAVKYESSSAWLKEWARISHFVAGRIEALEKSAEQGNANKVSKKMAYRLFANLVDYSEKYQGMKSVILDGFEAVAEVELGQKITGTWTIPPYFLDSVSHIAGFVMNGSDAMDTVNYYCVTPGWESVRIAKPLVPGGKYRSYVKMIPTEEDPTVYLGDVYILEGLTIIGMVGNIQFRRYPRILLSRFFSPPDASTIIKAGPVKHDNPALHSSSPSTLPDLIKHQKSTPGQTKPSSVDLPPVSAAAISTSCQKATKTEIVTVNPISASPPSLNLGSVEPTSTTARALALIADEAGLEQDELRDEASFAELGVDSLMSLVIAEKFREQLNVIVQGSLFLEYPTVGHLRTWLKDYYD